MASHSIFNIVKISFISVSFQITRTFSHYVIVIVVQADGMHRRQRALTLVVGEGHRDVFDIRAI